MPLDNKYNCMDFNLQSEHKRESKDKESIVKANTLAAFLMIKKWLNFYAKTLSKYPNIFI